MLLFVLNVIIIPLNFNKLFYIKDEKVNNYNEYENGVSVDSIAKWLEIDSNIIYNMNIDNGEGELKLKSWEKAYSLEEKDFDINEIKIVDDNIIVKVIQR